MASIAQIRRQSRITRHRRVRKKVHGTAARPRLAVFRSNKHVVAQVIDDDSGPHARRGVDGRARSARRRQRLDASTPPTRIGRLVAERAKAAGIDTVVFDRGGFIYHGRIAALATAAREAGLEF